jgi:hypothetical protein
MEECSMSRIVDSKDIVIPPPKRIDMKGLVTRQELLNATTKAALAVGEKMYDQLSGETAAMLTQMETEVTARVVERLSLRGRLRALRDWLVGLRNR